MATKNLELTTAEKEVLRLYREYWEKHRAWPTYRYIAGLLGVQHNNVLQHVRKLEEKGFLVRKPITVMRLRLGPKGKRVALKGPERERSG